MKIKLVYKSRTGFTKRYSEWIAQEVGCELLSMDEVRDRDVKDCDVLIFGSRLYAGRIDGLARARKLFSGSGARDLVVFATGAAPASPDQVDEMWRSNLTSAELAEVPHFYMPGGICYEQLGLLDKTLLKMAARLMKKQARENPAENQAAEALQHSYDLSDKKHIDALVDVLRGLSSSVET